MKWDTHGNVRMAQPETEHPPTPDAAGFRCPVEAALSVIGGKWKSLILFWLKDQTLRFGELRDRIPGISERMLTQQLRELEADGIVHREVYAVVPPRVEYSLTPYGQTLRPVTEALCRWGTAHIERLKATP